jgi:hypothetical protein
MKDLPHHIKKLNRRVIRDMHRDEMQEMLPDVPKWEQTEAQKKKQAKIKQRDEKKARPPVEMSDEERNKKMKHRTPVFDRNNAAPKAAKKSQKKTPKI